MAMARNTSQKNRSEAEKGERVRALRNAPETTTMAAAVIMKRDMPIPRPRCDNGCILNVDNEGICGPAEQFTRQAEGMVKCRSAPGQRT